MKEIKSHIDEHLNKLPSDQRQLFDAIIDYYESQLSQRDERIKELESRLNKDSQTSSKPPSSDGLKKRTVSLRKPGEKKAGAQINHSGATLKLVDDPQEIILHAVKGSCTCGKCLEHAMSRRTERRQVVKLEIARKITEHQVEIVECPQEFQFSLPSCFFGRRCITNSRISRQRQVDFIDSCIRTGPDNYISQCCIPVLSQ